MNPISYQSALKKLAESVDTTIQANNNTRNQRTAKQDFNTQLAETVLITGYATTLAKLFDLDFISVYFDLGKLITVKRIASDNS